ncbi:hypothetical protein AG1IA_10131 [Rhizoctonia solani AG-1 IA]|uniref:Uncharacterized protein n=1 Tax=Thanatephorus cucumeris (strain AG1-IA) TaxID=983506 RepID=L8WHK2_THACA|nr:hypothetical protein AG1IA_10131 [Rhizoctonia solani AG-1 IA]
MVTSCIAADLKEMPRELGFSYRGYNFGFSAFLNGQFLGSGQGRAATDPAGQLDLICDVYLFRSCGQRGECGYCCDRQHGIGARLDFGRCSPWNSWVRTHWGQG